MSRILIMFFSMGGHTRRLAEEIRSATGADIEEIIELHPREGAWGMLRALWDASLRRKSGVLEAKHNPVDYDLLVLGGPIWARHLAAPVRTFAEQYGSRAKRVAFFCTEGKQGADTAFADLEKLCQHKPLATLTVDAQHLAPAGHRSDLGRFVACLRR
ncbi:flavodoxin family protein [Lysobacter niabensis]|uniref:flavodoxin family protein n=1 Tax=Agrilutibacter niabensis TaxID=380628 RepID=UPI00360B2B10